MLAALLTDTWPVFLGAAVLGAWWLFLGASRPRLGGLPGSWGVAIGLVLGGLVSQVVSGRFSPSLDLPLWDQALVPWTWLKLAVLLIAGILLGFGAARMRGFTARSLLVALATAVVVANTLFLVGGWL
ncbi:MAG: hypothetical protein GY913_18510 [Proteobacteria bacterium]|nr:hypothetical protein [Pseudomonadota bacterium]MCP4918903.1 hypothetical protein [Pseudomonadota bacterium]